jgi:hypothetical protein
LSYLYCAPTEAIPENHNFGQNSVVYKRSASSATARKSWSSFNLTEGQSIGIDIVKDDS